MRSFCSALNMPDSHLLRSTACGSTLQDQTQCLPAHRFAATLRCEGNRRHRQALTFARVNVAVVKARKEHVMRDEKGRKVETAVEARAGFLDRAGRSVREPGAGSDRSGRAVARLF